MTKRDAEILAFLRSRPSAESLGAARAALATWARDLEQCVEPRVQDLVGHRLVASHSLLRAPEQRLQWDAGNAFIAREIAAGRSPGIEGICDLNAIVNNTKPALRSIPLYGCNDEYLSVEALPEAVAILEGSILQETDPLLRAALLYIWMINAHPFADGNGRTGRLASDWILLGEGYPPLCFHSNVQGHVAYGQADRYPSMDACVLKCLSAIVQSYRILLGTKGNLPS